jgi:hypothetical protein
MEKMIGYCGYNCHLCAARSDDPAIRQRMVDGWRRIFGYENYTAQNVKCDGCRSDGKIADTSCKARPCARERGVESCAQCDEFACSKVKDLIASREGMLVRGFPRTSSLTEDEYSLCMRQFDSLPGLLEQLAALGRLPAWVARIRR